MNSLDKTSDWRQSIRDYVSGEMNTLKLEDYHVFQINNKNLVDLMDLQFTNENLSKILIQSDDEFVFETRKPTTHVNPT